MSDTQTKQSEILELKRQKNAIQQKIYDLSPEDFYADRFPRETKRHTFGPTEFCGDWCKYCGKNFRDNIHLRANEKEKK